MMLQTSSEKIMGEWFITLSHFLTFGKNDFKFVACLLLGIFICTKNNHILVSDVIVRAIQVKR